jgi:hypothetical protein
VGQRVFNVSINGTQVLTNFDIIAAAGAEFKAIVKEFTVNADSSGHITIGVTTVVGNGRLNGIEILTAGSTTPATAPATAVLGEASILPSDDSGNANLLLAQKATLDQAGTLQSLSFYVTQAAGSLRLGIYDATGPNGGPGALLAQTNAFVPVVGWNTAPVITPVHLAAGTYWLAYVPSDNNLHFRVDRTSGTLEWFPFTFGAMPAAFSTTPTIETGHWSFYATLTLG